MKDKDLERLQLLQLHDLLLGLHRLEAGEPGVLPEDAYKRVSQRIDAARAKQKASLLTPPQTR